ncbi:MAG: T9SS type A sorting domain-containing protein [Chitinophagaceae bacterium]|nr:T9SS type A sorting domain-containing protein [Chitinophagaceae bacterium]
MDNKHERLPYNFNNSIIQHDTLFKVNNAFYILGHSNICDSSGQIIFSCDGGDVFNNNGDLLFNGDKLIPNDYYIDNSGLTTVPQTSIFLPMDSGKYYLITPSVSDAYYNTVWANKPALNWNFDVLYYHVIDKYANAGAGAVVQKKVPLLQNTPMKKSQMMACRHGNGKDWWLLKMAGDSNKVFVFLFSQNAVTRFPDQYIPFPFRGTNDLHGQMVFNVDGSKWATTGFWINDTTYATSSDVYVADFDRCYGKLSNFQVNYVPPFGTDTAIALNRGLAFSPSSRFLYVSKYSTIQQLDLQDGSWWDVHGVDSPAFFCGYTNLQLAPVGKIYIGRLDGICKAMSVINNPDVEYGGCNFCVNCLRSESVNGYFSSPPNMANYELGAITCYPEAISEVEKNRLFKLYPLPPNGKIYIELKINNLEFRIKNLQVLNLQGQVLLQEKNKNEVDLSILSSGVYFLQLTNERMEKLVYKVIKE